MKKLLPIIILVLFLGGCAGVNEYAEGNWRENTQKWAVEQNKKCPIKTGDCLTITAVEYTPNELIYYFEIPNSSACDEMVMAIQTQPYEVKKVLNKKLGIKVARMYVSITHIYKDEQGQLISTITLNREY